MNEILEQLQKTQIEILDVIDSVCQMNGLHYSLYAGTLLGAVRHKGFIPWDDDLDVCMPRGEYDKFIELWPKQNIKGYILQNKENTPDFTQSFTKIRKDNTCLLETERERGLYHTGIFVDIFPVDRIPNGKLQRVIYNWECMKYTLYMREFVPPKGTIAAKFVSQTLLALKAKTKRPIARTKFEKKLLEYDGNNSYNVVCIETVGTLKQIMPAALLNEYVRLPFGEKSYMCFKMWDEYLGIKYGDYMKLPPVENRAWKHHPIIIDFEHNCEDIGPGEAYENFRD